MSELDDAICTCLARKKPEALTCDRLSFMGRPGIGFHSWVDFVRLSFMGRSSIGFQTWVDLETCDRLSIVGRSRIVFHSWVDLILDLTGQRRGQGFRSWREFIGKDYALPLQRT